MEAHPPAEGRAGRGGEAGEASGVRLEDQRTDVLSGDFTEDYRVHWRPPFVMVYTLYDAYTI